MDQDTSRVSSDQHSGLTDEQILGMDRTGSVTAETAPEVDLDAANAELELHRHGEMTARTSRRPDAHITWRKKLSADGAPGWIHPDIGPAPKGFAEQKLSPEVLDQLRLSSIPGVGPRIMSLLLERFGSARGFSIVTVTKFNRSPGSDRSYFNRSNLKVEAMT